MSRMALSNVRSGKIEKPLLLCLYGPEGIGKSTFGSDAPSPIFMGRDDGTNEMDVDRMSDPETWEDLVDGVKNLMNDEHGYKTLVIDTLDSIEPLLFDKVCRDHNKQSIEEWEYSKGYTFSLDYWLSFLHGMVALRDKRGMNVILLAHSNVKMFKNPEGDDYSRYEMKLRGKASNLIKERMDALLFVNYEVLTYKKDGRPKGLDSGSRLIHTERRAAFDAKNRFHLPPTFPLGFKEFMLAKQHGPGAPAKFQKEIARIIETLEPEDAKKAAEYVKRAGSDNVKLSKTLDWCRGKVVTTKEETDE